MKFPGRIGIDDDFFALGGHSLKATALVSLIHKEFNIKVPLTAIFRTPSLRGLGEYIRGAQQEKYAAVEPAEKREYYALSPAQQRLFILQQMGMNNVSYNLPRVESYPGLIDAGGMKSAFEGLIRRHESLRTSFAMVGEEPVQRVHEEVKFDVEVYEADEPEAEEITHRFIRPFDISRAPLLRAGLIKLKSTGCILLVDMHHIITDGTSNVLLKNEFNLAYTGKTGDLPLLRLQYKDYARWQNSGVRQALIKGQETYWLKMFAEEVPVLNLPTDYPRPLIQGFTGSTVGFSAGPGQSQTLKALAKETGATLYMCVLSVVIILLSKLSGQEDIIVGTPIVGRRHADLEKIIGMFVNTLALRNKPSGEKRYKEFLRELKEMTVKAYENQEYQFENLVDQLNVARDTGRNPVFDVMFNFFKLEDYTYTDDRPVIDPGEPGQYTHRKGTSKFDLTVTALDLGERIHFSFEYCSQLYKPATIERFISYFKKILALLAENSQQKLSQLEIITEAEKQQILYEFNETNVEYRQDTNIHTLFAGQVEKTPDQIALEGKDKSRQARREEGKQENISITYNELNQRSDRLASRLKQGGVEPETIVGIMVDRCWEMIAGILAILKAGGAYLPIDPDYPQERVDFMLKDSGAKILLKEELISKATRLTQHTQPTHPAQPAQSTHLAYVIYTSGTTGKPKGVAIEHHSLVNRLNWMQKSYPIDYRDTILQKTTFTFDVSVWEIFWWMFTGARVCLLEPGGQKDPGIIKEMIVRNGVTVIHFVPSMLSIFLDYLEESGEADKKGMNCLRQVFASGEALTVSQVKRFNGILSQKHGVKLANLYGPTEATIDVTYFNCAPGAAPGSIPIGKPIDNIQLYVLSKDFHLQPVGVPGELGIAGVGLARGYLNRPGLTAEKFTHDLGDNQDYHDEEKPFRQFIDASGETNQTNKTNKKRPGKRIYMTHKSHRYHKSYIYRTGDLALWQPDGNIEFLGRLDHQVKIRGFRIELEEIQARLQEIEAVKEAVVVDKADPTGEKNLYAYIVGKTGEKIDVPAVKNKLSGVLPAYMVPLYIVELEAIPLTSSGKVDRKALPGTAAGARRGDYTAPGNRIQMKLCQLWSDLLGIKTEQIGIDANFFEMGGHSLRATILTARIQKTFNVKLTLTEIFKTPTIRGLSRYIQAAEEEKYAAIEPVEKKEYYALSPAQQRLFILQQMGLNNISYNLPRVEPFPELIDAGRMKSAFKGLIRRHESLRTSFAMVEEEPVQRIHEDVKFDVEVYEADEPEAEEIIDRFTRPFDLSRAPLLRAGLIKLKSSRCIFLTDMHHIITDGTSNVLLKNEFNLVYSGKTGDLPLLRLQYKDYARWQNSEVQQALIKGQETYWLKMFADEIPVLDLPTDYPRSLMQSFAGCTVEFLLTLEESQTLKTLAKDTEVTLYMSVLSVFTILLSKLSGQEDIVIGTALAARRHTDLEKIIGMFVNTLALRNKPAGGKVLKEFFKELKKRTLEAYENQEYPFEQLVDKTAVKRDTGRNPVFDVMYNFMNLEEYTADGIKGIDQKHSHPYKHRKGTAKFDLTLTATDLGERVLFAFEYCTKLFKPGTIERFISYFKNILALLAKDSKRKLSEINIITEAEKHLVLYEFNDTGTGFPVDKTIHGLFAEQVYRTPDSIAISGPLIKAIHESRLQISYRELNKKSNRLAYVLQKEGVEPGDILGIMVERSIEMIIGILGILRAGGAYLPITPGYPRQRIDYMLKDSGAKILLSAETNPGNMNEALKVIDIKNVIKSKDDISTQITQPAQPCYIIYTSGTTGKPKGVLTTHSNVIRVVKDTNYIDLRVEDRLLQLSNYAFDGSVFDIYGAFLNGAALVLVEREDILAVDRLAEIIKKEGITVFFVTTALFNTLVELEIECFPGIRKVLFGGERVSVEHCRKALEYLGKDRIIHVYGPTETTVYATYYFIDSIEDIAATIPIGKPLSNTTTYILDKYMKPVPLGVGGEIYIGGEGTARGYLNSPALTAEKFIRNPFVPGDIFYRSGDLARFLEHGNIEFLGRIDSQVKIRGFRIELGEIEKRLVSFNGIKEAVVLPKEDRPGDRYLCAYFVSGKEIDDPGLRRYMASHLPEYMIPSYFIRLEKMPLTPNGKLDRNALPGPGIIFDEGYAAPGNKIEKKLVEIWADVLGIENDKISINANFFRLGGHSLKATVMTAKIHKQLNVRVPLAEIFKTPFISGLSGYISRTAPEKYESIAPVEKKEYYVLSPAQKRLYILEQMEEDVTAYNIPLVIPLEEDAQVGKLEDIFKKLIKRHESLRTSFRMIGDQPLQQIHEEVEFEIEGLAATPYKENHETHEKKISLPIANCQPPTISEFIRPFDLSVAPLLRVKLLKAGEKKNHLLVDMHHIITDGTSQQVLTQDFMSLSRGEELPALRIQYKDFSGWQNSNKEKEKLERQEVYWLEQFEGEIPVLNISTDYPRPALQSFEGSNVFFEITPEETGSIMGYARKQGVTLYMMLLAVTNILLSKLTGQEDIVIGTPLAGRRHADLEKIIGMFVNTLALRNYPSGEMTFPGFLKELKEKTVEAFENQDYQFEDLVEKVAVKRDTSRNPLFDVMFVLQHFNTAPGNGIKNETKDKPAPTPKEYDDIPRTSKFDLSLIVWELESGLRISFEYCTKLFKKETGERFMIYFYQVVSKVLKEPGIKISEIEIIPQEEKKRILYDFNDTQAQYPKDKTIHRLFEEQVDKIPDQAALVFNHETLTFRRFDEGANRLANYLKGEKCIRPGDRVAVLMDRSIELIVTLMGVMKARGAYVPLDVTQPGERLRVVFNDAAIGIVLCRQKYLQKLTMVKSGCKGLYAILSMEGIGNELNRRPPSRPETGDPHDPAYVMYTSGSTGTPKGVLVEHRTIVNTLDWRRRYYEYGPGNVSLQLPPYFFDSSVTDIFTPLLGGARLVLVSEEDRVDLTVLKKLIPANQVSHFIVVPAFYNVLLEEIADSLKRVKMITCAGEHFPDELIRKHFEKLPGVRIFNEYGPTENSVNSTAYELKPHSPKALIGKPISNVRAYILDRYMRLNPIGVTGEICLSGSSLARGYLNSPELTAQKFPITGPPITRITPGLKKAPGKKIYAHRSHRSYRSYSSYESYLSPKIYKSGDMGKWLSDGNLEFLGRIDSQVKIRGIRIETGEIENHLMRHENIKEALVVAHEGSAGEKYLCAYVVPAPGQPGASPDLKSYLAGKLPGYMIPTHFIEIAAIPFTPTGKINREALPEPGLSTKGRIAPGTRQEERLAAIWADILDIPVETIGSASDFFQLGGHSLKATIAASRIHKAFNVKVPLAEIFTHPTLQELAKYIGRAGQERFAAIGSEEKKEYYPLSPAQKRLHLLQQMDLPGTAYNLPQIIPIETPDIKRFETAFKKLIRRHESLRTSFHLVADQPVQRVHEEVEFEIEYGQAEEEKGPLGQINACDGRANEATRRLAPLSVEIAERKAQRAEHKEERQAPCTVRCAGNIENFIRPFDLSQAPLMRSGLFKLADGTYTWMVDMHHIITDGVSHAVLKDEFNMLYTGKVQDLPPQRLQYKDYTQWQNRERQGEILKRQETYWLKEFSGEVPVLQLPTDYPRPFMQSFAGCTVEFTLSAQESQTLKNLAKKTNATLYMSVLAVFNILLSKLSGQEDIIVGTPVMARRHTDLERIIGMFVNTLAMRNQPAGEKKFPDFLSHVKKRTLTAYENQEYPFEDLVDKINVVRDIGRNPVFDVMFNFLNIEDYTHRNDIPGNAEPGSHRYHHHKGVSKFDLTLSAVDLGEQLRCWLEYCTKLFKPAAIERFIGCFKKILALLSKNSDLELTQLEIITESEKQRILYEFNDTNAEYRQNITLHELFAEQVEKTPDRVALVGSRHGTPAVANNPVLTYRELYEKSTRLAHLLKEKNVKPGTIVGIMTERSMEMMISLFGILKAGAAYLPIDPNYPGERIRFILSDSSAAILLTDRTLAEKTTKNLETVLLDFPTLPPSLPSNLPTPHLPPAPATSLAYIIYTSGSTGRPRGVMIEHRSVVNRLNWMQQAYPIGEQDVILQKTPITFDVSVWELFWWSFYGASLCLAGPGEEKDPAAITATVTRNQVTTMHFVPSMLNAFLEHLEAATTFGQDARADDHMSLPTSLRQVFSSGEALKNQQVVKFNRLRLTPNKTKLINLYGPTEATVDVSYFECPTGTPPENVPIGKPIDNIRLYIVDKYLHWQPVGTAGELCIGGVGLARGYLNNPGITAQKFCLRRPGGPLFEKTAPVKLLDPPRKNFPLHRSHWSYIYRTGDLARWLPDGNIEFLGRMDFQVKIRGFRIELGEIENRLKTHPGINDAIVIDRNDNERQYLCAYVTAAPAAGKGIPSTPELKEYLEGKLPGYMIPAAIVTIEHIPLNSSGKVDRNRLPLPSASDIQSHGTYEAPVSGIQQIIAGIWQEVLGREKVGIRDNFFDLGGNSLDFIKISNKLKEKLDREIPVVTLFTYPTIASLESYLTREQGIEEDDPGLIDEGKDLMRLALDKLDNED